VTGLDRAPFLIGLWCSKDEAARIIGVRCQADAELPAQPNRAGPDPPTAAAPKRTPRRRVLDLADGSQGAVQVGNLGNLGNFPGQTVTDEINTGNLGNPARQPHRRAG
jgi:hypothetical protein